MESSLVEHDRNWRAGEDDDQNLSANELGENGPQTIILTIGEAILDRQIPTFNVAGFI